MATFEHDSTIPLERPASDAARTEYVRRPNPGRWLRELGWRYLVGFLALVFALYPIVWIISASFNSVDSLTTARLIPPSVTLDNYTSLFDGCSWKLGMPPFECASTTPIPIWLWNTVKIGLIASTIQLVLSSFAAYSFSRMKWSGRRVGLIAILLIQMFPQFLAFVALFLLLDGLEETFGEPLQVDLWVAVIPLVILAAGVIWMSRRGDWDARMQRNAAIFGGVVALIVVGAIVAPTYGVTLFPKIGLGTHTGLIIVYLGGAIGVNTWLIKGFMDSIPYSLDEAARMDGATDWDIFSKIILPLAKPILIVIFILTFVGLYNEFILAAILVQDVEQFTFATGLNLFVDSEYAAKWGQLSAAALIGMTPILIIFWSLQDRIVSGLQGAVKG